MDVVFWAALGFLLAAIVVGTAFVAVRAWRAWQACVSLALVGAAGADCSPPAASSPSSGPTG
jgi:hypothetical protein